MKIEIRLPNFPGFYETFLNFNEEQIERDLTNSGDELANLEAIDNPTINDDIKRIKNSSMSDEEKQQQYVDILERALENIDLDIGDFVDYKNYEQDVSKACAEAVKEELVSDNIVTSLKYVELISPKEYNFSTDQVIVEVEITDKNRKAIMSYIEENYEDFEQYAKDNFTSYDGFMSWVESNPKKWTEEYIFDSENADRNLSAILEFIVEDFGIDSEFYYNAKENIYDTEYVDYDKMYEHINEEIDNNVVIDSSMDEGKIISFEQFLSENLNKLK